MKKRLLMNAIVVASLLVLFAGSTLGLLLSTSNFTKTEMNNAWKTGNDEFYNFFEFEKYGLKDCKTIDELVNAIAATSSFSFYPTRYYLADESILEKNIDGIIAKSGTTMFIQGISDEIVLPKDINGDEYICNIADYMNDQVRDTLNEAHVVLSDASNVPIIELNYNIDGNKLIPISMKLMNEDDYYEPESKDRPIVELDFSDEKPQYRIDARNPENELKMFINFDLGDFSSFIDGVENEAMVREIYKSFDHDLETDLEILSMMKESIVSEYEEDGEVFYGSGSMDVSDNDDYSSKFSVFTDERKYEMKAFVWEGKKYVVLKASSQNNLYAAVHNSHFQETLKTEEWMFGILLIVLLVLINLYLTRSEKLEHSRQAFTNAVAHELKTPLAIIQNQCECVMEGVAPEKNATYMDSIYEEAQKMNVLVMSFLQYNRLTNAKKIERKPENLSDIVIGEFEIYEPLMLEKGIEITQEIDEDVKISCNHDLIALAIGNYLSNAMKYATRSDDSPVKVSVKLKKLRKNGFELRVYNDCVEKPTEKKEIWNIMSRMDASRNRNDNSTGMGLPVTAEILKLHGFKYGCESKENGVEFYIKTK